MLKPSVKSFPLDMTVSHGDFISFFLSGQLTILSDNIDNWFYFVAKIGFKIKHLAHRILARGETSEVPAWNRCGPHMSPRLPKKQTSCVCSPVYSQREDIL